MFREKMLEIGMAILSVLVLVGSLAMWIGYSTYLWDERGLVIGTIAGTIMGLWLAIGGYRNFIQKREILAEITSRVNKLGQTKSVGNGESHA